jgi:hypothetical protein
LSLSYQKYRFGIRDPEKPIPDPETRLKKAPDSGSGSATLPTILARHRVAEREDAVRGDGGRVPAPQVQGGADPRLRGQPCPPLQAHQPYPLLRGNHLSRPQV